MKSIPNVTWLLICCEMTCDTKAFIFLYFDKNKTKRALSTYFQRMDSTWYAFRSDLRWKQQEKKYCPRSRGKPPRPRKFPIGEATNVKLQLHVLCKALNPSWQHVFFPRLWIIIAKALGIKLHPNEKPITSAILHILTFGSAAGTKDFVEVSMLTDLFQPSLSPMGWYPGTVSCRSTRRKTSSTARSALWWCPSSVDWGFTLTGWHTGRTILIFRVEKIIFLSVMLWVHCQAKLLVFGCWRTLLKATSTALWSEASVSMWFT